MQIRLWFVLRLTRLVGRYNIANDAAFNKYHWLTFNKWKMHKCWRRYALAALCVGALSQRYPNFIVPIDSIFYPLLPGGHVLHTTIKN